jgi:hypothetical protein
MIMPRIMTECPSTHQLVPTGYRSTDLDLQTMLGDRAFRCPCGKVHVWNAGAALVEETRSLDYEIAAEMRSFGEFHPLEQPAAQETDTMGDIQHRTAVEGRLKREALFRPW